SAARSHARNALQSRTRTAATPPSTPGRTPAARSRHPDTRRAAPKDRDARQPRPPPTPNDRQEATPAHPAAAETPAPATRSQTVEHSPPQPPKPPARTRVTRHAPQPSPSSSPSSSRYQSQTSTPKRSTTRTPPSASTSGSPDEPCPADSSYQAWSTTRKLGSSRLSFRPALHKVRSFAACGRPQRRMGPEPLGAHQWAGGAAARAQDVVAAFDTAIPSSAATWRAGDALVMHGYRCPSLLAGPGRRALFEKRAHALLGVAGLSVGHHHVASQLVGAALVEFDLVVERLLPDPHRQRARARDLGYQHGDLVLEIIGRHDPVDESPLARRLGVDRLSRQQQLERALATDRARDRHHRGRAE